MIHSLRDQLRMMAAVLAMAALCALPAASLLAQESPTPDDLLGEVPRIAIEHASYAKLTFYRPLCTLPNVPRELRPGEEPTPSSETSQLAFGGDWPRILLFLNRLTEREPGVKVVELRMEPSPESDDEFRLLLRVRKK